MDKVTAIAEGNTRRGGSLGMAGVSVGTSVSTVAPQGAGNRYYDEVAGALADLSDRGRVPVLLHVNNLENLRDYLGAVAGLYRERLVQRLGEDLFGYLEATLRAVAPSREFRAADVAKGAGVSRARATQVVDEPLERRVVRRGRTEQASKYLVPGGEVQVALDGRPSTV